MMRLDHRMICAGALLLFASGPILAGNLGIERVSFGQAIGANLAVEYVAVAGDGRYVAFSTAADNLAPGDINGTRDVFVHDRQTGEIEQVSVSSAGIEGDSDSYAPSLSDDGRYVAFLSAASNLVAGDVNGTYDIFVRDRETDTTTRVSVATGGAGADSWSEQCAISGDGRYVAFSSDATNLDAEDADTNGVEDIFRHDRNTGTTIRVSKDKNTEANARSGGYYNAAGGVGISRNGKYIVFLSEATNLINNDTNGATDVFVVDADHPQLRIWRVSVVSGGGQGEGGAGCSYCAISPDGLFTAFSSTFDNLVEGDTNGVPDIFRNQRDTMKTVRVSVDSDEVEANGASLYCSVSFEGVHVAFFSEATNLVAGDANGVGDVFLRNVAKGTTQRVSLAGDGTEGDGASGLCAITGDGQAVAFVSAATNLVQPDANGVTDAFVHVVNGGITSRASELPGAEGDEDSLVPLLSDDGHRVAFTSSANNLVEGDTGGIQDVFMLDRPTGELRRISVDANGVQGNGDSDGWAISADGNCVVFVSDATNLVPGDINGSVDVFLYDWSDRTIERVSVADDESEGDSDSDGGAVSTDGRYVAFLSTATNLVAGDTNSRDDIFLRDRTAGTTERVSLADDESELNDHCSSRCAISGDGNRVVFVTAATNAVAGDTNALDDVFVRDRALATTERINLSPLGAEAVGGGSGEPSMSTDGLHVAFSSSATNLAGPGADTNGCIDIFVHDGAGDALDRMLSNTGAQGNDASYLPRISADGRLVAYSSDATNLVSDDTNGLRDVFVCDRLTEQTRRLSVNPFGPEGNGAAVGPLGISADGRHVAFASEATNLVSGDTNASIDVFVATDTGAAVTYGQTFQLNPGDVEGLNENFVYKPKVVGLYTDPIKLLLKKKTAKVLTLIDDAAPPATLRCEWKGKIALFNKKLVPKTSTCQQYFGDNPIAALDCDLQTTVKKADGTKLLAAASGSFVVPPPEIMGVYDAPGGVITSAGLEDTVVLDGAFFGAKKPKVWLEYYKKGVVKAKKLTVITPLRYPDVKGVAGKSCMDVDTGKSEVRVLMPSSWPTGWDHNVEHNLVIDNGLGRDSWPFRTDPPAGQL